MVKHTKSPRPSWLKIGLIASFLLIVMASSAAQAFAEDFGVGAEVEVEVEVDRTQHNPIIDIDPPDNNPSEFGVGAEPPIDLVAAAMFLFPIVLMGIALAFDNPVFASLSGIVFIISGIYFLDIIWLMMVFVGLGIYLLVTAFMSEED